MDKTPKFQRPLIEKSRDFRDAAEVRKYLGECVASGQATCKCNAGETIMLPDSSSLCFWWGAPTCQTGGQGSSSVYGYTYCPGAGQGYCSFSCFK